jgi:hypothetical protein
MGSNNGMKEMLEKVSAKIDDMKASLDKLAPLAPMEDQLASIPTKVVTLQSAAFENSEQIRALNLTLIRARTCSTTTKGWRLRVKPTPITPPSHPRKAPIPLRRPRASSHRRSNIDSVHCRISPGAHTRRRTTPTTIASTRASA